MAKADATSKPLYLVVNGDVSGYARYNPRALLYWYNFRAVVSLQLDKQVFILRRKESAR